ncbi:hypothetical protein SAMN03159476_00385 [Pseudomonas sp. NFPP05]|nr:hypothetical protein SAMN03159465_00385 [Pseudomonas sp. NFPP12]SFM12140.1 hypothetical protein SAMN03159476_00385 [Pseudomonas sp. NFPP05]
MNISRVQLYIIFMLIMWGAVLGIVRHLYRTRSEWIPKWKRFK